ncbi:MAG: hypothetical protein WDO13_05105 [Verrucomicrobiota bacterium]
MLRLFLVHSLRYFARHPALTALNIVGIALGVTVFPRRADHQPQRARVVPRLDRPRRGKANLENHRRRPALRRRAAWPLVAVSSRPARRPPPTSQDVASLTDFPGEYLQLLGVDIFSDAPLRTLRAARRAGAKADVATFLRRTRA